MGAVNHDAVHSLSVTVAAHPKRKDLIDQLLEKLDGPAVAVWDESDDEWDTHMRAWRTWESKNATHHLVLQDDAIVPQNLWWTLENALEHVPARSPVSLYFGRAMGHPKIKRAVQQADEQDASWIVAAGTWWGVGIIIPTILIPEMLSFCTKRREVYDRRLSIWCEHGPEGPYPVYYPWPSLVDHLDVDSLVMPGRAAGRKAYRFIGEDAELFNWDPSKGAVACGRVRGQYIKLEGSRKGG